MVAKQCAEHGIIKTKLDQIEKLLNEILTKLNGNGSPGIIVRLDRLEQVEKTRRWLLGVVVTQSITLIFALFLLFVKMEVRTNENTAYRNTPDTATVQLHAGAVSNGENKLHVDLNQKGKGYLARNHD